MLFQFETVQRVLDQVQIKFATSTAGDARPVRYPSGYAFLFDADADTVIGHKSRKLYGTSVSQDHNLPELHEADPGE